MMLADLASVASLFLLAALIPNLLSEPEKALHVVQELGVAVTAIALGIGGFLSLVRDAIWSFITPDRGGYRKRLAPGFTATGEAVREMARETRVDQGLQDELTTTLQFHMSAPPELVNWVRRRRDRYAGSLNAAVAIGLGLLASFVVVPSLAPMKLVAAAWLALFAVAILYHGLKRRQEADAMVEVWLRFRGETSP